MAKVKEGGYYVFRGIEDGSFTVGKTYRFSIDDSCVDGELVAVDDVDGKHYATPKWLKENFVLFGESGSVSLSAIGTTFTPNTTYWAGTPTTKLGVQPENCVAMSQSDQHKGLRFNKGKIRYDLLHPVATEGIARVMTKGALKYAERNWEKGMLWSNVLASLKRHLAAFEKGIDYDSDSTCEGCKNSTKENWICKEHTGELHVDLIQTNAHFLSAYYKIYPQGDDRPHNYLATPKIGLDIDEVICDWVGAWTKKYGIPVPKNWSFDPDLLEKFEDLKEKGELDNFYLSLNPLIKPEDIPFEPHCYITSRPVSSEITEKWLAFWRFPARPVYTTTGSLDKTTIAKREGLDIFVDDSFDNFTKLNKAGICCFLMDASHNQRYNVGYKRIKNLKDLL